MATVRKFLFPLCLAAVFSISQVHGETEIAPPPRRFTKVFCGKALAVVGSSAIAAALIGEKIVTHSLAISSLGSPLSHDEVLDSLEEQSHPEVYILGETHDQNSDLYPELLEKLQRKGVDAVIIEAPPHIQPSIDEFLNQTLGWREFIKMYIGREKAKLKEALAKRQVMIAEFDRRYDEISDVDLPIPEVMDAAKRLKLKVFAADKNKMLRSKKFEQTSKELQHDVPMSIVFSDRRINERDIGMADALSNRFKKGDFTKAAFIVGKGHVYSFFSDKNGVFSPGIATLLQEKGVTSVKISVVRRKYIEEVTGRQPTFFDSVRLRFKCPICTAMDSALSGKVGYLVPPTTSMIRIGLGKDFEFHNSDDELERLKGRDVPLNAFDAILYQDK